MVPFTAVSAESTNPPAARPSGVVGKDEPPKPTPQPGPDHSQSSVPGETKEARDARMGWWRDAKFGMFIHWGVFSVPAGFYHGKPAPKGSIPFSEWLMWSCRIPVREYRQFAKKFNPVQFNAEDWVNAASDAGMKYIVITSKHHDGFAMFDSKASDWNIVQSSPYGKDPIKELALACRKHGMKLGFYYSQAQDWVNGGAVGLASMGTNAPPPWDKAMGRDMDAYIKTISVPQVREICSKYGEFPQILWWDTPRDMNPERAAQIQKVVQELRPGIIQNNRLGGGMKGDTETPEGVIPPQGYPGRDWETCMTFNDSWGYKKDDNNWKSTETLIRNLCDIASKGGNYLLNVGPDSHGEIPAESVKRLAEVGAWMKVNGEAIYGTTATPFGAEAGSFSPTKKDKKGQPLFNPDWTWRATQKPAHLYLILFKWPTGGEFTVPAFAKAITAATLLADPTAKLTVRQDEKGITVSGLPAKAPDAIASVIDLKY
jgi:alpha-L-fucosidase